MSTRTIHQVDPIELRKKLLKLGIGPKFPLAQTAAEGAVDEAMGSRGGADPEIDVEDGELCGVTVTGEVTFCTDVDVDCPHCGKSFTAKDVEVEGTATVVGDVDVDAEFIAEHVSTTSNLVPRPTRLEPEELAYMVHAWAMLWEVPA